MIDHDELVGSLLDILDELGIADNTIVMYSTDNGPHMNSWPDAGMTPFRNEKNSNWEGAYRVPAMVRWPGHIPAGTVLNGIVSHNDWFVTLLAAAGGARHRRAAAQRAPISAARRTRCTSTATTSLPYLTGETDESPRQHFFYVSDDGDLTALRLRQLEVRVPRAALHRHDADLGGAVHRTARAKDLQSAHRPVRAGRPDVEHLLRLDVDHIYMLVPAQAYVGADAGDVRRVPATAEVGELQPGPGDGQAAGGCRWQQLSRPRL